MTVRYRGLYDSLSEQRDNRDRLSISFTELEEIIGGPLPPSARKHRAWWSNSRSHSHASAWLDAGWRVESVDMTGGIVTFVRETVGRAAQQRPHRQRTRKPRPMNGGLTSREFEEIATVKMAEHFGVELRKGKVGRVPKVFDMVSEDESIVGDAKYFTMVRGHSLPPAKFSVIAEHVWLLSKTGARRVFLVFGNDRRVPEEWLRRYGHLVGDVEFYFLDPVLDRPERL